MTIEELMKFAETYVPTEEDTARVAKKFAELEEQFEQDAKRRIMTAEWLNKPFSTL